MLHTEVERRVAERRGQGVADAERDGGSEAGIARQGGRAVGLNGREGDALDPDGFASGFSHRASGDVPGASADAAPDVRDRERRLDSVEVHARPLEGVVDHVHLRLGVVLAVGAVRVVPVVHVLAPLRLPQAAALVVERRDALVERGRRADERRRDVLEVEAEARGRAGGGGGARGGGEAAGATPKSAAGC